MLYNVLTVRGLLPACFKRLQGQLLRLTTLRCRDEATRTPDPYVPNVVRYQLRYIPIFGNRLQRYTLFFNYEQNSQEIFNKSPKNIPSQRVGMSADDLMILLLELYELITARDVLSGAIRILLLQIGQALEGTILG